jgi:uncharacterized protein
VTRVFLALLAAVALLSAAGGSAFAERRRALVIGIDHYANLNPLKKAAGDARSMKAALEALDFEVEPLLPDPDRRALNLAVFAFTKKIEPGDVALIHFSGHGVAIDGENFLLPSDVPHPNVSDREMLKSESLALTSLIQRVRQSGARTLIFIIDACRDNPYANADRSLGPRGLAMIQPPRGAGGIFIMYSAGYGQTAADRLSDRDPEPTSVYTRALLKKIKTEGKALTDLAREVREDVEALAATAGHEQRPAYYDELSGPPFYFMPPKAGITLANRSPEFELAFWNSIKDAQSTSLYQDYLDKFGEQATFASIAHYKLKQLDVREAQVSPPTVPVVMPKIAAPEPGAIPSLPQPQPQSQPPVKVTTFSPSFDCKADKKTVERVICADAALASRDRILSDLFYKAIEHLPADGRTALREGQRLWVRERNDCGQLIEAQIAECIAGIYDKRIIELEQKIKKPGKAEVASLQRSAGEPVLAPPASAARVAPSFECRPGQGAIEQAICADDALAAKDRKMSDLYDGLRKRLPDTARKNLLEAQLAWKRERAQCREPMNACLAVLYDKRIRELEGARAGR